ncbi:MAG: hypothetical protein V4439_03645 [Patescibacteria group bacterium]
MYDSIISNGMNQNKTGLVLGTFFGFLHLVWGVLVAFGWAQPLMDFITRLHSLTSSETVLPFDLMRSLGLVVLTFFVGYVLGNIFAFIWNKIK